LWVAAAVALMGTACTPSAAHREEPRAPAAGRSPNIDHLTPARDSIGAAPTRFTWTAIDGAEMYAIGIWNEVDVLVWRFDTVPETSITLPPEVRLEPGTYFWSISALREGREIAQSGLAAFVVRTAP
jgi:hypothetical protein